MYKGLEFYPGNPFDAVKIGIKRDNFREIQLLHEYGMIGIGKGNVSINIDGKTFRYRRLLGSSIPGSSRSGNTVSRIDAFSWRYDRSNVKTVSKITVSEVRTLTTPSSMRLRKAVARGEWSG
jgi:hypothetical protein